MYNGTQGVAGGYAGALATAATAGRALGESRPSEPTAPIQAGLQQADKSVAELAAAIAALESRLSPVLRPIPPQTATDTAGTPRPVCSHVAESIDGLNNRLAACLGHLAGLQMRVEV